MGRYYYEREEKRPPKVGDRIPYRIGGPFGVHTMATVIDESEIDNFYNVTYARVNGEHVPVVVHNTHGEESAVDHLYNNTVINRTFGGRRPEKPLSKADQRKVDDAMTHCPDGRQDWQAVADAQGHGYIGKIIL